jgi:hypothetical protein
MVCRVLTRAMYVFKFEGMKTRFYSENIFSEYTRYNPGISMGRVYTWYIPSIYQEKIIWGLQIMIGITDCQYELVCTILRFLVPPCQVVSTSVRTGT